MITTSPPTLDVPVRALATPGGRREWTNSIEIGIEMVVFCVITIYIHTHTHTNEHKCFVRNELFCVLVEKFFVEVQRETV